MSGSLKRVSVIFGYADKQTMVAADVPESATVEDAIRQSGILERHPEIDLRAVKVGVFGKVRALDAPVAHGERVEIYRPLQVDPKQARRERARASSD